MQNANALWANNKNSLMKFFKDAPSMDLSARLKYFHDTFPYAELLPVNFYLFDSNLISLACNQMTLSTLCDQSITDYVGYAIDQYSIRKGWPMWTYEKQMKNNRTAMIDGYASGKEISKAGPHTVKWMTKKEAIYLENGDFLGIIGISMLMGSSSDFIQWDDETKRTSITFNEGSKVELSMREFNVLKGLLEGGTAQEMASVANISPKTVETYIHQLKAKLNCEKQRDIIALFIKNELAQDIILFKNG